MSKVAVFLATGFEESEALVTVDLLRRAKVDVDLVSITDDNIVTGSHGIKVLSDMVMSQVDFKVYDALVLPGGMPGTINLGNSRILSDAIVDHFNNGRLVAAICAAPSIFGQLGIADGFRVTCFPGFEEKLSSSICTGSKAESDRNMVTGRGAGTVVEFALLIIKYLCGRDEASRIASAITTPERLL